MFRNVIKARWARAVVVLALATTAVPGSGAAAQVLLGGHPYQVNVMVGEGAANQRVAVALAVARSFALAR